MISCKKFKCSGYKIVILFGLFKLATFLYLVSLTKSRIIPKYKQNVLIDVTSSTGNDNLVSVLFDLDSEKPSKLKAIRAQIPSKKLSEKWFIYLIDEENNYNKNLIQIELSHGQHTLYYYNQTVASTYDGVTSNKKPCIDLARLLVANFEEKDFVIVRIGQNDSIKTYDLLLHLIKENAYKLIDHIYIDQKVANKSFPDFFSRLLKSSGVNELKTD